jgi:hypothetical protein
MLCLVGARKQKAIHRTGQISGKHVLPEIYMLWRNAPMGLATENLLPASSRI